MSWYSTGTVAVTNGNATITGTGTAFVANVEPGDIFWGPEGRGYEVVSVVSNTSLTIGPAYAGATASGQAYRIAPTLGAMVALGEAVNNLIGDFGGIRAGIGAGIFPDGTVALPALRFGADADTGLYRIGTNALGFATGGVQRMRLSSNGHVGVNVDPGVRFHVRADPSDSTAYIARFDAINAAGNDSHGLWVSANAANNMTYLHSLGTQSGGFGFIAGPIGQAASMTLTSAGTVGIGTETPTSGVRLDVVGGYGISGGSSNADMTNKSVRFMGRTYNNAHTAGLAAGLYVTTNETQNMIFIGGGDGVASAATNIRFATAATTGTVTGTTRWEISPSGNLAPWADNSYNFGSGSLRLKDLYLANNPTVTSDAREKTWRGAPTPAEIAAARRIVAELGFFQWNDAVDEKGPDGARLHFGVRAQAVWAIMADEGLIDPLDDAADPSSRYAFLCWDKWDEKREEVMAEVEVEKTRIVQRESALIGSISGTRTSGGSGAGTGSTTSAAGLKSRAQRGFLAGAIKARIRLFEAPLNADPNLT